MYKCIHIYIYKHLLYVYTVLSRANIKKPIQRDMLKDNIDTPKWNMITSTDADKSFAQNSTLIYDLKILRKLGIQGNVLNLIKNSYKTL